VWRLHTLPGLTPTTGKGIGARNHLDFTRLRPPAKRWARLRLTAGLAIGTVVADIGALARFSAFLTATSPEVDTLAGIDRGVGVQAVQTFTIVKLDEDYFE
jgi:hypothetical protein